MKQNPFQIVENEDYESSRWITFLPNNNQKLYGILLDFTDHEIRSLQSSKIRRLDWADKLINGKKSISRYKKDVLRNPTLTEYLTLQEIIGSIFKYNKKTHKLLPRKCVN